MLRLWDQEELIVAVFVFSWSLHWTRWEHHGSKFYVGWFIFQSDSFQGSNNVLCLFTKFLNHIWINWHAQSIGQFQNFLSLMELLYLYVEFDTYYTNIVWMSVQKVPILNETILSNFCGFWWNSYLKWYFCWWRVISSRSRSVAVTLSGPA